MSVVICELILNPIVYNNFAFQEMYFFDISLYLFQKHYNDKAHPLSMVSSIHLCGTPNGTMLPIL